MPENNDFRSYESETMALPALKMVLGDIPSPNPEGWRKDQKPQKLGAKIKPAVQHIIVHLEKKA